MAENLDLTIFVLENNVGLANNSSRISDDSAVKASDLKKWGQRKDSVGRKSVGEKCDLIRVIDDKGMANQIEKLAKELAEERVKATKSRCLFTLQLCNPQHLYKE